MKENIIQVDFRETYDANMVRYSLYVLYARYVADIRDGLKTVQRRILYDMFTHIKCISKASKVKSARTVGDVMGRLHAHSDCLHTYTNVFLTSGHIDAIGNLYNNGIRSFEALGVNERTGKVEPVFVHDLRIGQYTNRLYHITLNNGYTITCTSNHPFMMRDLSYTKAENLKAGDKLYSKMHFINSINRPCIYANGMIQDIVSNYYNGSVQEGYVRHHIDGNPFNNSLNNIQILSRADHALIHQSMSNDAIMALEKGRSTLKDENSFAHTKNMLKNSTLMKLYTKDQNFRRFKFHINKLIESGIDVTVENYEALRKDVYNLPSIDTLIKNGYGNSFEELVSNDIASISELYNDYKNSMEEMCELVNGNNSKKYISTKKDRNGILRVDSITIEYIDHPEPMYDFTVDTTHNMLIPADTNENIINNKFSMICIHNSSIYDAMKCMTNWFEIKLPLVNYDSNSGSLQGGPQAAMRYTESYMSKFALECVIGELAESDKVINKQHTFDGKGYEPESLPVKVPLLLVNGTFAIAIGRRIEVPSHSLNDVIDATIMLMHNPKAEVVLIPDPCQKCEVICDDWRKISATGFGHYIQRGIIKTVRNNNGTEYLRIMSTPDLVFYDSIKDSIEDLMKANKLVQIADIQDESTEDQLDVRIILKKGADSNYVKQVLYKSTELQSLKRVNMEIIDGLDIKRIDYKTYILYFLEYRRNTKFRLYNARLQKVATRQHMIEPYVKILDSGEVDKIIKLIKNQKSNNENDLVEYLIKKLDITDLQAKFILNVKIKQLTKAQLTQYKEEYKKLNDLIDQYYQIITNRSLIDQEIEAELLDIKAKYGKPRQSIEVSMAKASDIPEGEFKIVITENNFIKKLTIDEPVKAIKGDSIKSVLIADNSKDILIFDNMGKVFRLAVNNISFTDRNSPGIDIRLIIRKFTSNAICAMYQPFVKALDDKRTKFYLITVSRCGLVKKVDLGDIVNAIPSGLMYSRVNQNDEIVSVLIANSKCDVVINNKSKAIRIPLDCIPNLKRTAIGPIGMRTSIPVEGASIVSADKPEVIVVTYKGRFNRLLQSALPKSDRGKAGSKVISLVKNDYIVSIIPCASGTHLRVITKNDIVDIDTNSIPIGSSVSSGTKLCKDGIVKVDVIK